MEIAFERTTNELQKYRQEYKELTNKLNEINEIMNEREKLYYEKLQSLTNELNKSLDINEKLNIEIKKLQSYIKLKKEKYSIAKTELENATKLLEIREQDIENKLLQSEVIKRGLYTRIYDLEDELNTTRNQMSQLAEANVNLNKLVEDEMISILKYNTLQSEYQQLQEQVNTKMISLESYTKFQKQLTESELKYNELSDKIENMISKEKYNELEVNYNELVLQYNDIQSKFQSKNKKLQIYKANLKECQLKNNLLLERIESYTTELKEINEIQIKHEKDYECIENEYKNCNEIRIELENTLKTKENEIIAYRIQLGNTKQLLTKERQKYEEKIRIIMKECKEWKDVVERLYLEINSQQYQSQLHLQEDNSHQQISEINHQKSDNNNTNNNINNKNNNNQDPSLYSINDNERNKRNGNMMSFNTSNHPNNSNENNNKSNYIYSSTLLPSFYESTQNISIKQPYLTNNNNNNNHNINQNTVNSKLTHPDSQFHQTISSQTSHFQKEQDPISMTSKMKEKLEQHEKELNEFRFQLKVFEQSYLQDETPSLSSSPNLIHIPNTSLQTPIPPLNQISMNSTQSSSTLDSTPSRNIISNLPTPYSSSINLTKSTNDSSTNSSNFKQQNEDLFNISSLNTPSFNQPTEIIIPTNITNVRFDR